MHAASPVLVVATFLAACLWSVLLWKLWVLRHVFEIAARAPVLVAICGAAALLVLLTVFVHWILLLDGRGVPCYVMLVASYFCMAACMFPYCLRALKLVVAYNTQYRLKYARYVKDMNILKMSVVMGTGVFITALLIFIYMPGRYGRDQYGCFFFNERRAIELTLLLGVVPTIFAVFQLMKVRDVFGIGPEIIRVIIPILLGVVSQMIIQELLYYSVLEDNHIVHFFMELIILVCTSNMLFWSALVPVSKYHGWHGDGKTGVVPLEAPIRRAFDNQRHVYYYAQEGGEVADLFGDFCRKNLCMESWDFVLDSVAYKKLTNPQEQFASFMCIVDQYLRRTSPQEVNLGSKMQERLLPFQTRCMFTALDEVTRHTVLEAAVNEIVLMLEHNIGAKFKLTPAMQHLEHRKCVGLDINSTYDVADEEKSMMTLTTSVSVGSTMRDADIGVHKTSRPARNSSASWKLKF